MACPLLYSCASVSLSYTRDWQQRPQLDEICRWWSDGGPGVCALIGIGGAGKTAIADRFLQLLPGAMPFRGDLPKRSELSAPERLFVFSFYVASNPDSFFVELFEFLTATNPRHANLGKGAGVEASVADSQFASYQQTLRLLQVSGPCLLVLDGLEKVQDDGLRGGIFGELQDRRLSDVLIHAAEGTLPGVSVLITSRFPLAELDERGSFYHRSIAVEEIDVATAVALLRRRGVRGTHEQLRDIADDCGHHALTVDLAGGYIAEFGGGEPDTLLQLTRFEDEQQARRAEPTNARRRAVRLQEYRFARIAERYRDAIKSSDPAALALLERICLYRLGVTAEMLAEGLTEYEGSSPRSAHRDLANMSRERLQQTLNLLTALRLIELTTLDESSTLYSIHPAVREGFLRGMGQDMLTANHRAICTSLRVTLGIQPHLTQQTFAR